MISGSKRTKAFAKSLWYENSSCPEELPKVLGLMPSEIWVCLLVGTIGGGSAPAEASHLSATLLPHLYEIGQNTWSISLTKAKIEWYSVKVGCQLLRSMLAYLISVLPEAYSTTPIFQMQPSRLRDHGLAQGRWVRAHPYTHCISFILPRCFPKYLRVNLWRMWLFKKMLLSQWGKISFYPHGASGVKWGDQIQMILVDPRSPSMRLKLWIYFPLWEVRKRGCRLSIWVFFFLCLFVFLKMEF